MKKIIAIGIALILLLSVVTVPTMAAGEDGPSEKSTEAVYLYEKTPSGTWPIVDGGAWGKLTYTSPDSTFDFVFNGKGLEAGENYTLIYYPDKYGNPWPREDIICLGSDTANGGGNVHIAGSPDTGDLPNTAVDINNDAKIWLVLSEDVYCAADPSQMFGWNPTEYLFENNPINFNDTDD